MRQLALPFGDDSGAIAASQAIAPTPSPDEARILDELAEEDFLTTLDTPEARQRHFARRAEEERRRAVEARRISH